jgi:FkbM family methyltransferase
MSVYRKASYKARQVAAFWRHTRTPLALSLDALRLKRSAFVAVSGDGLRLRLDPRSGESFTFYENLVRRDYLADEVDLKPGATVVDIGANIGAFAVLAATVVGPSGRVVAFEPVSRTFDRLRENLALNRLGNVEACRAAVDAEEGTLTIRVVGKSAYATAHGVGGTVGGREESAPCLTLERVFRDFGLDRVDLLKVDCEGSEYGIFEGLTPELAGRIGQIVMEVHPVAGKSPDRLHQTLRGLGFEVRRWYPWVAVNVAASRGEAAVAGGAR